MLQEIEKIILTEITNRERSQTLKYDVPEELMTLANNASLSKAQISHLLSVPYWEVRYVVAQRGRNLPAEHINTLLNDPVRRVRQAMRKSIRK